MFAKVQPWEFIEQAWRKERGIKTTNHGNIHAFNTRHNEVTISACTTTVPVPVLCLDPSADVFVGSERNRNRKKHKREELSTRSVPQNHRGNQAHTVLAGRRLTQVGAEMLRDRELQRCRRNCQRSAVSCDSLHELCLGGTYGELLNEQNTP